MSLHVLSDDSVAPPGLPPAKDMVWIPGGTFLMGSNDHYPEEAPAHPVTVSGFWIDQYQVTNAAFRRFVKATGYVTVAERVPDAADLPRGAARRCWWPARSSSRQPPGRVAMDNHYNWWDWVAGADWRHPEGPGSTLDGRERHPVRPCRLGGRRGLRRLGRQGRSRPRRNGNTPRAAGRTARPSPGATSWRRRGRCWPTTGRGSSPGRTWPSTATSGPRPVGSFPPNGYGLFDMIGNAWEWTADWYTDRHEVGSPCCGAARQSPRRQPRGERRSRTRRARHPAQGAQGRLVRLRRELLPALPSRRAHAPPDRHRHQSHQLPLRRPARRGRRGGASA